MSVVLCRLDEIADGESRGFEHELEDDDIEFFVVRKGQSVFGYFNDCPHIGTPLNWKNKNFLTLDNSMIVCATHGAVFESKMGIARQARVLARACGPSTSVVKAEIFYCIASEI